MHLELVGLSYYLVDGDDSIRLTRPQYQAFMDLCNDRIELDQLEERVAHYEHQGEYIDCPYCGEGALPRNVIETLGEYSGADRTGLHDALTHRTVPQAT